ncbi:MAG: hypothetical protein KKD21_10785 [Proteobacteria bacterium]|nr:hypothetical protein [Pseudomonadota bacterium]MBU1697508.1 hypothetical protein [Pseudomonadota bacterium]
MPPVKEQVLIVESVKIDLSIFDNAYPGIAKQEIRSAKLRQSILKKAFTGKLVPQGNIEESPAKSQKQSA